MDAMHLFKSVRFQSHQFVTDGKGQRYSLNQCTTSFLLLTTVPLEQNKYGPVFGVDATGWCTTMYILVWGYERTQWLSCSKIFKMRVADKVVFK